MTWQWWIFLAIGLIGLVLEIMGVVSKRKDDTITEGFRAGLRVLPQPVRMIVLFITVGLLVWTAVHFMQGYL